MGGLHIGRAETAAELLAVQRMRYAVYVEELGRYKAVADHHDRRFAEPEDEYSWVFYARDGDEVVATTRVTWGGHGFSERQIAQYDLAPFLDELPADVLVVGERAAVLPQYRGTNVLEEMMERSRPMVDEYGIRVVFGCCEPHLLGLYLGRGQRPYAGHNINSEEAGFLIPLVAFVPEPDALRGLGKNTAAGELPDCVQRVLAGVGSVKSGSITSPQEYWHDVHHALEELHAQGIAAFDGFEDDETERCIARSNILECDAGDRILKAGGSARNIFVVLAGTLEVRDNGRLVGVLTPGDAFGEMAFLLQRPRTFDVDAVSDGVRILSLSEGALRKMIADDPVVAAKLLLNLSKMLCVRLIRAS